MLLRPSLGVLAACLSISLSAQGVAGGASGEVRAAVAAAQEQLNGGVPAGRGLASSPGVSFAETQVLDGLGKVRHHRFAQLGPGGYPVVGAQLVVHEGAGAVSTTNGGVRLGRFAEAAAAPFADLSAARRIAEVALGAKRYRPAEMLEPTILMWVPEDLDFAKGTYRLAYRVDVYADQPLAREYVYVDADADEVVARESRILHTEEPGTAETRYHGTREITTQRLDSGGYRLYQREARGTIIHTRNALRGSRRSTVDFLDDDNAWSGANEAQDEAARDAFWAAGEYHDLLSELLGYQSIDNDSFPLICNVHVDSNLVNAFWDGATSNYGDGSPESRINGPLTSIDIVAHEFTHGLTQFSAGLRYAGESGALNESFSDIYGVATRLAALPERAGDYSIGSDVDVTGRGIRSLADPNAFNHPDTYGGDHYYTGTEDRGGVHVNSGVQNHWFYLLSEGGSGVNDHGYAYEVRAIGWEDALRVAHETLTGYLTPSSSYPEAAAASVAAAEALWGACDDRAAQVAAAWAAVGLPAPAASDPLAIHASTVQVCDPTQVVTLRSNAREGAAVLWDFGDGTTGAGAVVEHVYDSVGAFAVAAYATDCAGEPDTAYLARAITVDPAATRCEVFVVPDTGEQVTEACGGLVTDAGGDGPYANRVNGRLTIRQPGIAEGYLLTVESFELERHYDYLTVVAIDEGGVEREVGRFTGTELRPGDTLSVAAASVAFDFTTDASMPAPGFAIAFEAVGVVAEEAIAVVQLRDTARAPVANYPVEFSSEGATGSLRYDFGDGRTGRGIAGATVSHTFRAAGTYVVRQIARTCSGRDTAYATIEVLAGSRACTHTDTVRLSLTPGRTGLFAYAIENCGEGPLYVARGTREITTHYTSTRYVNTTTTTSHDFGQIPAQTVGTQALALTLRYSGDFDGADEYLAVDIGYERFELVDDGNPRNGSVIEAALAIPGHAREQLARYGLQVRTSATGGSDFAGALRSVSLAVVHGDTTVAIEPSEPLSPGESYDVAIAVPTGDLPPGTYRYSEGLTVSDTSRPGGALAVPVALTLRADDRIAFEPAVIELGEVHGGQSLGRSFQLRSLGTDDATLAEAEIGAHLSANIELARQLAAGGYSYYYADVTTPDKPGAFRDSLRVRTSSGREAMLLVRGEILPPGELRPFAAAGVRDTVSPGATGEHSITLHNDGLGPLSGRLYSADHTGRIRFAPSRSPRFVIPPGDSVTVGYTADATEELPGEALTATFEVYLEEERERVYLPVEVYVRVEPQAHVVGARRTCGPDVALASRIAHPSLAYTWSLGDGAVAEGPSVSHAYATDGSYEVMLRVCDSVRCDSAVHVVEVAVDCEAIVLDGDHPSDVEACRGRISSPVVREDWPRYADTPSVVVRAPLGAPLTLGLTEFGQRDYWAELFIYEVIGDRVVERARWDRHTDPGTDVEIASGVAKVVWWADGYGEEHGFVIDFGCDIGDGLAGVAQVDAVCGNRVRFAAESPAATDYRWAFGDGGTADGADPEHTYAEPGRYAATVYASGPDGYADSLLVPVQVEDVPELQILTLDEAIAGEPLVFAAEGAFGSDGAPVWSTSDGQTATGSLISFTFPDSGAYVIEATATLEGGCLALASQAVVVAPQEEVSEPVDTPSSLIEARARLVAVYPNPARREATVRLTAPTRAVVLRDHLGREVLNLRPDAEAARLDLTSLASGVYLVDVRYEDGTRAAARLVVEN